MQKTITQKKSLYHFAVNSKPISYLSKKKGIMIKKHTLAAIVSDTFLVSSCSKETCARCELIYTCITCTGGSFNGTEFCETAGNAASFASSCEFNGGTVTNTTTRVEDTRELCNEEALVVNAFMDDKTDEGYNCQYVD
jgi:hypothetical protein